MYVTFLAPELTPFINFVIAFSPVRKGHAHVSECAHYKFPKCPKTQCDFILQSKIQNRSRYVSIGHVTTAAPPGQDLLKKMANGPTKHK